jgi:hypothetical protein
MRHRTLTLPSLRSCFNACPYMELKKPLRQRDVKWVENCFIELQLVRKGRAIT